MPEAIAMMIKVTPMKRLTFRIDSSRFCVVCMLLPPLLYRLSLQAKRAPSIDLS